MNTENQLNKDVAPNESWSEDVQKYFGNEFHILLVDDEVMMQEMISDILEDLYPFKVDTATTAEEAFAIYKKGLHKIIIIDIRLGGEMNGYELLKKIKRVDSVANCIMVTGYATIAMAVDCMKSGAWDFITKPFTCDHLEMVVKRSVENLILQKLAGEREYYMELSRLDSLTEVYNRRLFDIIMKSEFSRCKRYNSLISLVFLDIDNFKFLNDLFGHQKGDETLKKMAFIMKSVTRESDFVFRFGGDEFAVILTETDEEGALIFCKRLINELNKVVIEGYTTKGGKKRESLSVSMGISVYSDKISDVDTLLKKADQALFKAKESKGSIEISKP